jgi:hypothetical protein
MISGYGKGIREPFFYKGVYSTLFGWSLRGQTPEYWMIRAGISGVLMQKESEQILTIFIEVESIEDHTGKAKELASRMKEKQGISELFMNFRRFTNSKVFAKKKR